MFVSLFVKESLCAVSRPEYPPSVVAIHSTSVAFSKKIIYPSKYCKGMFSCQYFLTESHYGDHRPEYLYNDAMLHSGVIAFFSQNYALVGVLSRDILV